MDFDKEFENIVTGDSTVRLSTHVPKTEEMTKEYVEKRSKVQKIFLGILFVIPVIAYICSINLDVSSGYTALVFAMTSAGLLGLGYHILGKIEATFVDSMKSAEEEYVETHVTPWLEEFYGVTFTPFQVKAMYYNPIGVGIESTEDRLNLYEYNDHLYLSVMKPVAPTSLAQALGEITIED
jgi:hypothetical protein